MVVKHINKKLFDKISMYPIYRGGESVLLINPDNPSQLLKVFKEDVAKKESTFINIAKAAAIQPKISYTDLPLGAFYVDDQFKGSIIKHYFMATPIERLRGLTPKNQTIVLRNLVKAVKELSDNYVYPIGLSFDHSLENKNTSSLFSRDLSVHLIDLDGSSAEYSDEKIDSLDQYMLMSTNATIVSLLKSVLGYEIWEKSFTSEKSLAKINVSPEDFVAFKHNTLPYGQLEEIVAPILSLKN